MAFWTKDRVGAVIVRDPHRKQRNKARVYVDINQHRPPEYWDYENYSIEWATSLDQYEVVQRIGKGKYSEVFEGMHIVKEQKIVIKTLKPVAKKSIKREIMILQNLCGGTNIIQLLDVVKDPDTQIPSLIFEYVDTIPFRKLFSMLTDLDIRYYIYQLLKALDYAHSNGIMHRDVKPGNVMINHNLKTLRLIDWGLAEFYHKDKDYNVRVATKFYKAPELLVDMTDYDYSVDLWATGCMLAAMIFQVTPFFKGKDNQDQLVQIAKVLGTENLYSWLDKYGLVLEEKFKRMIGLQPRVAWGSFMNAENKQTALPEAIDFLDCIMQYEPSMRLTAREAMEHPYFHPVKK